MQCLDKGALHEGGAGFRINRSCMDNVYTLNEIVQGRLREDKKTYAFFLDIQKTLFVSVWADIILNHDIQYECHFLQLQEKWRGVEEIKEVLIGIKTNQEIIINR